MDLFKILDEITWEDCKKSGSAHYKNVLGNKIEPVDLYRALGVLKEWAATGAIRRSSRMLRHGVHNLEDVRKIIHEMVYVYIALRDSDKSSFKTDVV